MDVKGQVPGLSALLGRGGLTCVEDIRAVCSAVVQRLVDDVPGVTLALVVLDLAGDVGLDGCCESRICPGVRGHCAVISKMPPSQN